MRWSTWMVRVACAVALAASSPADAQKVRIGYWTSGVSIGFGSVLESRDFLKQAGVDAEFVRFSDVNGPTRALAANAIDLAFGGAAAAVFSAISDGVPIEIFLATQPADVQFVVPVESPIKTMAGLRGKKVGMSPAGSSVAALAQAILAANHGIHPADFALVGGNESRLAQFLVQKQVDAAALRSVTIAQLKELKVRKLSSFAAEWKTMTRSDAVPYIGVGVVRTGLVTAHPELVARVIAGMRNALAWGAAHPADVAATLQKVANLPAADATAYAGFWNTMNRAALEPADIQTLKREHQLLVDAGTIKGVLPDAAFIPGPYQQSKTIQ